jgi:predicted nucleic acid-binding protein
MICVDASVAVKWVLDEERSDRAKALFRATERAGRDIVAPTLLPLEVTNILRQRTRAANGLALEAAIRILDRFLALPIAIHAPDDLHRRALALAHAFDLPAAYDARYLALAEHFGCDLWTDDERLFRRVERSLPFIRRLGDYPTSVEG